MPDDPSNIPPTVAAPPSATARESVIGEYTTATPLPIENPPATRRDETMAAKLAQGRRQIGKYEILEELGRGGMGVVYRAHQADLDRDVALKVIPAGPEADRNELARFHAEAETMASLMHPNIVQVFEVGENQNVSYLSMEYVEGGNLHKFIGNKALEPRVAAAILEPIARAIQYAHDRGVIHRDLKPSNILLTKVRDGDPNGTSSKTISQYQPKVADFGLAKRLDRPLHLTQTGLAIGTPHYMAPEQARGLSSSIKHTSDIYALGAILYEMLVGAPPFNGSTSLETMEKVVSLKPKPPSQLRQGIPSALEKICLKCLEKEAGKRYESASQLADELRVFLASELTPTVRDEIAAKATINTNRPQRWLMVGLLMVIAAVAGSLLTSIATQAWKNRIANNVPQEPLATDDPSVSVRRLFAQGRYAEGTHQLEQSLGAETDLDAPRRKPLDRLVTDWSEVKVKSEELKDMLPIQCWTTKRAAYWYAQGVGDRLEIVDKKQQKTSFVVRGMISTLAWNDTETILAIGTNEGQVYWWSAQTKEISAKPISVAPGKTVKQIVTIDERYALVYCQDVVPGRIDFSDKEVPKPLVDDNKCQTWAIHPSGLLFGVRVDGSFELHGPGALPLKAPEPISLAAPITRVAISSDAKILLAICSDGMMFIYPRHESRWHEMPAHGPVKVVKFVPGKPLLVTLSEHGQVTLWDALARRSIGEDFDFGGRVTQLEVGASWPLELIGRTERAWKKLETSIVDRYRDYFTVDVTPGKDPRGLQFGPDTGDLYVVHPHSASRWAKLGDGSWQKKWEYATDHQKIPDAQWKNGLALGAHGDSRESIFVWGIGNYLQEIDATQKPMVSTQLINAQEVTQVVLAREGKQALVLGRQEPGRTVGRLWQKVIGVPPVKELKFDFEVSACVWDDVGQRFLLFGRDRIVRAMNVEGKTTEISLKIEQSDVTCAIIDDSAKLLLIGLATGEVRAYQLTDFQLKWSVERLGSEVVGLVSQGAEVYVGVASGTVSRWSANDGVPSGPPWAHGSRLVGMTSRGNRLATLSYDRVVRLWDMR